jgi:hypothetical protein
MVGNPASLKLRRAFGKLPTLHGLMHQARNNTYLYDPDCVIMRADPRLVVAEENDDE